MRTFLRRPVFLAAIAVVCLILSGLFPGSRDRRGERFGAADGRRLCVTGTVQARECSAGGYRLLLDGLSFSGGDSEPSAVLTDAVAQLNHALLPGDRLQVYLSAGEEGVRDLYGETGEEDDGFWMNAAPSEDQTELFQAVRIGDRVCLYGKCRQMEEATNPGQFDARRYCLARRIVLKMSQVQLRGLEKMRCGWPRRLWLGYRNLLADLRIGFQTGLPSVFGTDDAAQAAAFILGDSSGLDEGTRQLFRNGGMSWLVCVSSLHISVLGMMLYRLLRGRGRSFLLSSACAGAAVCSYAMMTGFSLSAQRALVTFLVWLGAQVFGRTRDTLSSLSAAALIILVRQPYALWDSSFLLSCTCILSLEYLGPAFERVLHARRSAQRRICRSAALWTGSLPVVLWFHYQASPYGSILYPLLLPLLGIFSLFGLLAGAGGCLYCLTGSGGASFAGMTLAWPCRILLALLRFVCRLETDLPFSVLILGRPASWQMVCYGACLAGFVIRVRSGRRKRAGHGTGRRRIGKRGRSAAWGRVRACLFLPCLLVLLCVRIRPAFRFTCLDIGQGSCNLIEHGGSVWLFDAGSSSVSDVWKNRIDPVLKYYGIRRVDTVFLSHADLDHINGIAQMLSLYHRNLIGENALDVTIGRIMIPQLPQADERLSGIMESAAQNRIETCAVGEGSLLKHGEMTMKILHPSRERITGNANEDCIVMLLTDGNLNILLTGDLEKEGEEMFVSRWEGSGLFQYRPGEGGDGCLTVLIAGHHGSRNATSARLLEMVKPDLTLISCGKNNRYGHPAQEMLRRLEEAGVSYRRTDLEGAIQVLFPGFVGKMYQ